MKPKLKQREEARRLRREAGMPMKQIAAKLDVSPASVHLWTKDIQLTPAQKQRNMRRSRTAFAATWIEKHRAKRGEYQEEGRAAARKGDRLHLAGCMLFWAEGAKRRNSVIFVNSDVGMIAFFKRFLAECFGVSDEQFTLRLNVYFGAIQEYGGFEEAAVARLRPGAVAVRRAGARAAPSGRGADSRLGPRRRSARRRGRPR